MGLKDELRKVGLSKQELANKLGVSYRTILRMDDDVSEEVEVLLSGLLSSPVSDDVYEEQEIKEEVEPLSVVPIRRVVVRNWKVKGEKVFWQRRWWGRGFRDFEFSAATLVHLGKHVKSHGVGGAAQILSAGGADFDSELLRAVRDNSICPIIVDEIEPRFAGGASVPFSCDPWVVTSKLGDGYKPAEYFSKVSSD